VAVGETYLDVALFQRALEEYLRISGKRKSDICREIGFINCRGHTDTARLSRMLGYVPYGRNYTKNKVISHNNAVKFCRAIGKFPIELGF
jgi:hypothetical protein